MDLSERTRAVMDAAVVVDMTAPGAPLMPVTSDEASTEAWIGSYVKAGCTWVSFTIAADFVWAMDPTIEAIAKARRWFLARPERFVFVERADDVARAKREGKLAVSLHFQGTFPFQRNVNLVELFKRLGVFHALMAYNNKNLVGDGVNEAVDGGLSSYGRELIAEMNRVGMMVDISHTGFRTAHQTIEASTAPVIMSHCSPSAVFAHKRNVPDDLIVAMAKSGGVMGIHGVGIFMSENGEDASGEQVFRFVDHAVQLVGPKHVGFGLDHVANVGAVIAAARGMAGKFEEAGGYFNPKQVFASAAVISDTAEVMLRHNYAEADVAAIVGGNWLRVFRQVCG
jgi:membrane dipeptidase